MSGEGAPSETYPEESGIPKRTKAPSKYDLPSERFIFPTHFEVLRRFITATSNGKEPVPAAKVEGTGVPVQAAVLNAKFLTSIGLLEKTGAGVFRPTPVAIQLVMSKSVSDEKARPILRTQIENSWFAEVVTLGLGGKSPMSEEELLGELAVAAQTPFDKKKGALGILLDYLLFAGIVTKNENGIVLGSGVNLSTSTAPGHAGVSGPTFDAGRAAVRAPLVVPADTPGWETLQTTDFVLHIRANKAAVDDLRQYLILLEKKIERIPQPPPTSIGG